MTDAPEQRLARWAERDAVVGLDAELTEARAQLAERDAEISALRIRNSELANRVTQVAIERDSLRRRLDASAAPSLARRVYRKLRSLVGRLLPR